MPMSDWARYPYTAARAGYSEKTTGCGEPITPKSLNPRLTMNKIARYRAAPILPGDDRIRRHAQLGTGRLLHRHLWRRDRRPRSLPDPPHNERLGWIDLKGRSAITD